MPSEILSRLNRLFFPPVVNPKIFCIGRNKTGTTSLEKAFMDLGYSLGNLRNAELLLPSYIHNDFKPIIDFCHSATVFQDSPFSYPETYKHLDKAFPGSKFILSVRDSSEQWYNSITTAHSKTISPGRIPTSEDLKNYDYVYKGWVWKVNRALYKTPENDPYNQEMLIAHYEKHNKDVLKYFEGRKNLLVVNVSRSASYEAFCSFIGRRPLYKEFPWENKTSDIVPVTDK